MINSINQAVLHTGGREHEGVSTFSDTGEIGINQENKLIEFPIDLLGEYSSHSSYPGKAKVSKEELDISKVKSMNRELTKKIPEGEIKKLVDERNELVTKKFENQLSKKEERRLKFIRWQLDRIDDALHGEKLDYLEQLSLHYETFAHDVDNLLRKFVPNKKR